MKKAVTILIILLCMIMTGCSNEFAEMEYDSIDKISKTEDRYAKEVSIFNTIEGGYELTISKFDGRETVWSDTLDENDIYDVIFVVMRFSSLDSIISTMEKNKSKNIVFVGNNITVEKIYEFK